MFKGKERVPEYWVGLIADTLRQVDSQVQGAFLQKLFQSLVGGGVTQEESITHWEGILTRQRELAERLGRPVTLRTAAVDHFEELSIFRNFVFLEYEDLKKLRYDAATDALTGLKNRRMFEEYLAQEIDRSTRYGSSFALLSFDVCKFKSVNDTYGHGVGDEILRSVARASLETIRGSDLACRIGGDEFAILLPQAERRGSGVLAERIVRRFGEFAQSLAPRAPVGIDYGIAIFPEDGHDAASLLAAADRSLYARKQEAHDQSEGLTEPPKVTTPRIDEPTLLGTAGDAPHDDQNSHGSPSPVVAAESGDKFHVVESGPDGRRFERIRLEGLSALGIVNAGGKSSIVKVLDASRGGVCLLVDELELPETFNALLHVPMLPGGALTLQRIYSVPIPEGKLRMGCALAPVSDRGSA